MTTEEKLTAAMEYHREVTMDGWNLLPTDPKYTAHRRRVLAAREKVAELVEQLRLEEVEQIWPNGLPAHP